MTDEIRCDAPGPGGSTCVREYGHADEEGHRFAMSMELPSDVGQMLGGLMQAAEHEHTRALRMYRYYRRAFWAMCGAAAINVLCGIYALLALLPS